MCGGYVAGGKRTVQEFAVSKYIEAVPDREFAVVITLH